MDTIGYDAEQKSGYDMETVAPEAKRTTDEVHASANSANLEREASEDRAKKKS